MAYNNYFPQYFSPQSTLYTPQLSQASSQPTTGITWVQGENAAKSYPVAVGQSVLLLDSEDSVMYIKSTDQSGMPLPLRIFDYTERKSFNGETKHPDIANQGESYVLREEFEEFKEEIKQSIKGVKKPKVIKEEEDK